MFSPSERKNISYFKRFKMEIELFDPPAIPALPPSYYLLAWDESLLERHAEVMFGCFREEIDSVVFPSLGDRKGCSQLMSEIRSKLAFCPRPRGCW